jgi:hypothetical protein
VRDTNERDNGGGLLLPYLSSPPGRLTFGGRGGGIIAAGPMTGGRDPARPWPDQPRGSEPPRGPHGIDASSGESPGVWRWVWHVVIVT